jgi:hypothetical protein
MDICAWVSLLRKFLKFPKGFSCSDAGFPLPTLHVCIQHTTCYYVLTFIIFVAVIILSMADRHFFVVSPLHFSEFLLLLLPADE